MQCSTKVEKSINKEDQSIKSNSYIESFDLFPIKIDKRNSYSKKHLILQDVSNIKYIKLETNDNCLIGRSSLWQEVLRDGDNIFISANKIFKFNTKGEYLNEIGKEGEGPDEFQNCIGVTIDKTNKLIIVSSLNKCLYYYNYNGEFVKKINIEKSHINSFCMIAPDTLACFTMDNEIPGYTLRSSKDGSILKSFSQPYTKLITNGYFQPAEWARYYNGNSFFSYQVTDTIFSVNRDGRQARYILLPPNTERAESNPVAFLVLHFESSKFSYLELLEQRNKATTVNTYWVDKKNNEIYDGYIVDYNQSAPIQPYLLRQTSQDEEIAALYPMDYLQERLEDNRLEGALKEMVIESDADDNPILMIANFNND